MSIIGAICDLIIVSGINCRTIKQIYDKDLSKVSSGASDVLCASPSLKQTLSSTSTSTIALRISAQCIEQLFKLGRLMGWYYSMLCFADQTVASSPFLHSWSYLILLPCLDSKTACKFVMEKYQNRLIGNIRVPFWSSSFIWLDISLCVSICLLRKLKKMF